MFETIQHWCATVIIVCFTLGFATMTLYGVFSFLWMLIKHAHQQNLERRSKKRAREDEARWKREEEEEERRARGK